MPNTTASRILAAFAVLCGVLAACGVAAPVGLLPLAVAFLGAALLFG